MSCGSNVSGRGCRFRTIRGDGSAIWKKGIVSIGLLASGCSRLYLFEPPPIPVYDPYIGRSVANLAARFGPPTTQFDAGNGERAFLWDHDLRTSLASTLPSIPYGGILPPDALRVPQPGCPLGVVAHTQWPPVLGLNSWIVHNWAYTGLGCSLTGT